MSNAEYLGKAAELRADQLYWEAVKRNAYAELQNLSPVAGMYTDNGQEQLRSQISNAAYRLDQIAQELNRIARLQEAEAKEAASRIAIRNPVSEREADEFFEEQKRQLAELISSETFQAAAADSKEKSLAEKFAEQQRTNEEKFSARNDDDRHRGDMQEKMKALDESAMEVAKREQEIEKREQEKREDLEKQMAAARERMEMSGAERDAIEQKMREAAERAAKIEQESREKAELERHAKWEKMLQEQRMLEEQRQRDALRAGTDFAFH